MAKLHKIEMYIVDIDGNYGSLEDTIEHINDRLELVELKPFKAQSIEFDWHDDHKLNFTNRSYDDYRGFFPDEKEVNVTKNELMKRLGEIKDAVYNTLNQDDSVLEKYVGELEDMVQNLIDEVDESEVQKWEIPQYWNSYINSEKSN